MIISRTPFRISFFGGGTDYPSWFRQQGGAVLSTTFNKYSYISCRYLPPFFDHNYRISYSKLEHVESIEQIEHPAIRGVLNELNIKHGLEIHCDADLPARSGLGSSSSFVVGLLNALKALKGQRVSNEWLSREAIRIEQEVLGENVGSQDQIATAHGGFNAIYFGRNGDIKLEPLIFAEQRKKLLNGHLMLFFTGFSRISSQIAERQVSNIKANTEKLQIIRSHVDQAIEILCSEVDIRLFGELLNTTWIQKQSLSELITNQAIDILYERARSAGAIGGKILGAGGGGFMLLFVEPSKQSAVLDSLKNLIYVPFEFESLGSQIIHDSPSV